MKYVQLVFIQYSCLQAMTVTLYKYMDQNFDAKLEIGVKNSYFVLSTVSAVCNKASGFYVMPNP